MDQRPNNPGADGQPVGANQDLALGAVDRRDSEGVTVIIGTPPCPSTCRRAIGAMPTGRSSAFVARPPSRPSHCRMCELITERRHEVGKFFYVIIRCVAWAFIYHSPRARRGFGRVSPGNDDGDHDRALRT